MGLALPQGLDDDLVRRQPLLAGPFNGVWEGTLRVRAIDPTKGCGRCILSRCKQHSGRRIMRCGRRPHRGLCSQRKRGVRMPGEEMDEVSQGEEIREDERQNQKERARERGREGQREREGEAGERWKEGSGSGGRDGGRAGASKRASEQASEG